MLPLFLRQYFWEVRFDGLDAEKRSRYIIERLLEYGGEEAVAWLFKTYPRDRILEVLKESRALSRKSANFWAVVLGVPKDSVLCLSKQFRERSRAIWKR